MYEVFLTVIVIGVIAYWVKLKRRNTSMNLPPGPEPSLIFGNFKDLDTANVHQSLHKLAEKYGPVVHLRLLSKNIVILNTSDVIRKAYDTGIYRKHLNDKAKGFYGTYMVYNHSDVLLGPYTNITFRLKDIMLQGLKHSLSQTLIRHECEKLVQQLRKHTGKDYSIKEEIDKSFAEVLTMLLLGEVNETDTEIMWDFVTWSNKLLDPSVESVLKNFPILRFFPGKFGHLYTTAKAKRDVLLRRFLDDYRCTYKSGLTRGLVDTCLHMQETEMKQNGASWLTDDMIKALIMDTIGAGLVATTSTILAVLLNLLHNTDCIIKMQSEIDSVIGNDTFVSPEDTLRLPYCTAVVYETQRYSSLVPIVSHYCSTEDIEFEGYTIPKNTMVWGNIWSAHHDVKSWLDPWAFRPERFLDDHGKLLQEQCEHRQRLIPLGVGPRYCVGKNFAMTRLFTYITTIVQHFNISPPKESELLSNDPNLLTSGAVLQLQNLCLRLGPRNVTSS